MDRGLILETTFLVDLEREAARQRAGPAMAFLSTVAETRLYITLTTAGEVAGGVLNGNREAWERLIDRFEVLTPDHETAWRYGRVYAYLRGQGLLIGANDLWIAATALAEGMPLVTRNVDEFNRVPELEVVRY